MTTWYCASLYRCGIDLTRMDEVVVTEVSFPARMGWKTERSGSALCRTGRIYNLQLGPCRQHRASYREVLPRVVPLRQDLATCASEENEAIRRTLNQKQAKVGQTQSHRLQDMRFAPLQEHQVSAYPLDRRSRDFFLELPRLRVWRGMWGKARSNVPAWPAVEMEPIVADSWVGRGVNRGKGGFKKMQASAWRLFGHRQRRLFS